MKRKLKRIFIFMIVLIIILILAYPNVRKSSLLGDVYDFVMASEYRPVLGKDKKHLNANLKNIEEDLVKIRESCGKNVKPFETKLNQKKKEVGELSMKMFVHDLRGLKQEIFSLQKEVNKNGCEEEKKETWSFIDKKTYPAENYFSKVIDSKEGNYFVKIENLEEKKIKPKLVINDNDLSSMEVIAKKIVNDNMSEKEKALAIWNFVRNYKYQFENPTTYTNKDSIDLFNSWGYGNCGVTARSVIDLARLSGLKAREHRLGGHIVSEIYFEDKWHILDADGKVFYTNKDGSIANVEDIENNPELLKQVESPVYSLEYFEKAYLSTKDNVIVDYQAKNSDKKVEYSLKPKEYVLFIDQKKGDYFSATDYSEPPQYSNSFFVYNPENINGLEEFEYPFPLVGGLISGESEDALNVYISRNQYKWDLLYSGVGEFEIDYSSWLRNGFGEPEKKYYLKFSSKVKNPKIVNEVQIASNVLPLLKKGENKIDFFSDGKAEITFGFGEKK